ncbi:MAG: (Fe-S)-binding protein [Deltaproteobacteria bacterium]|nr:(Fe-S)-binding protein [Deltaproteobacteria bacterium]
MPEGKLCNRKLVDNKEFLNALLSDKAGQQYYEEMNQLDVDTTKLWTTIQKSFKSRMKTWLEICAHCGLCADSCFFYLANNKDPKQVPSYKIQSTLGEIIKRKGKVDNSFMQMTMDTAWSKCSCCNRCGMYCPFGIDMGILFGYLRGLCFSQGFVPWELKIGTGMHRIYLAQMDVTTEDWVDTCEWMAEENEDDYPGLTIPIDKKNADIIYTGDWEACKMQVESVYAAMDRLKPKRMVVTECGHAYRATVIEGPYWAGLKSGKTPVESFHYVEWVAEALRTGKLKLDPSKKIKEPVTYQDSCNYIRNAGLGDCAREIMSYIAEDFREMTPNREHNFCCGGGGGLNGIGRYREQRNIGLKVKLDQIIETGAKLVIAPCHNCWDAIRDMEEIYHAGIKWSFLKPILLDMVIVPEHLKPKEE